MAKSFSTEFTEAEIPVGIEVLIQDALVWAPSLELRWACEGLTGFNILQQKWIGTESNHREEEWRQVPFVDVSQPDHG